MCHRGIEVGTWLAILFDIAGQAIQSSKALKLVSVSKPSRMQSAAQPCERFIVGLERYRKGMTILATMCEREGCGILEAASCPMNDLCNQS